MKNFIEKIKNGAKKAQKFFVGAGLSALSLLIPNVVYADAKSDAVAKIKDLKDLGCGIVEAVGGVVLIYGVIQFALSFKKQDQHGETNAIFTIVAGIIMVLAGVMVTLFVGNE